MDDITLDTAQIFSYPTCSPQFPTDLNGAPR